MLGLNASMAPAPRYHFSGIAGSGMNPLARLMRERGHEVQGSDRSIDAGKNARPGRPASRGMGIELHPHDGKAVTEAIDRFVYSTAVEPDTPEMRAAARLGLELVPRPALLAEIVNAGEPGVAIAGTSGKSTITGMVAWLLRESRVTATVLGGAALVGEGNNGCFTAGPAEGPVVVEACESDGTLVGYSPTIGLVHNVSRDHAELASLRVQFASFGANCQRLLVNAGCAEAAVLGRRFKGFSYGLAPDADAVLEVRSLGPERAQGILRLSGGELHLDVPQPGRHNLENAAAAAVVGIELGLEPHAIAASLARFPGVARRFEVVGDHALGHPGGGRLRAQRREAAGGADHRAGAGRRGSSRCSSLTASGRRASFGPSSRPCCRRSCGRKTASATRRSSTPAAR